MAKVTHLKDSAVMAKRLAVLASAPVAYVTPFTASSLRVAKKKSKALKNKIEGLYSQIGEYTHGGHIIYSANGGYVVQDGYTWR